MNRNYKIALVQMKSSVNKKENLQQSVDYMKEAAKEKANLICFPEFQMAYSPASQSAKDLAALAENATNGNFVSTLRKEAKHYKLNVVATIYENLPNNQKVQGYHVSDTAVIISDK